MNDVQLHLGDCRGIMAGLPDASVDAIVTDPPYAEIGRAYGRFTEAEWHKLMDAVVIECRRVLKPTGSAVFVLQANQERVGRTRPWLWEFMAKWSREWNQIQDAWWWNHAVAPTIHCNRKYGLMRPSVKACVWLGEPDCFRDQDSVLWEESDDNKAKRLDERCSNDLKHLPSGQTMRKERCSGLAAERGGTTPFNLLPIANSNSTDSAGTIGHGAGTPHELADWWVRYISPPNGVVLDPFAGSGTIPLAAMSRGRRVIAIEQDAGYFETMTRRIERPHLVVPKTNQFVPLPGQRSLFDAFEGATS